MKGWLSTRNMNGDISLQFQQTLNTLMETLIKPETLKRDLFFALLLIVIKENDFVLKGNTEINVVHCILSKRMNGGQIYEVAVVLNLFQDTPAKIIATPLADMMLINAIIPKINKETHSLCLAINKYIAMNSVGIRFCDLDEMFNTVKEKIIVPVMSSILNYHSQPSCSLRGLPAEVLYHILMKLPINDILSVSASCTRLNRLLKEEGFWSGLCRRDFAITSKEHWVSWRDAYKNRYLVKETARLQTIDELRRDIFDELDEWSVYSLTPVREFPDTCHFLATGFE